MIQVIVTTCTGLVVFSLHTANITAASIGVAVTVVIIAGISIMLLVVAVVIKFHTAHKIRLGD